MVPPPVSVLPPAPFDFPQPPDSGSCPSLTPARETWEGGIAEKDGNSPCGGDNTPVAVAEGRDVPIEAAVDSFSWPPPFDWPYLEKVAYSTQGRTYKEIPSIRGHGVSNTRHYRFIAYENWESYTTSCVVDTNRQLKLAIFMALEGA